MDVVIVVFCMIVLVVCGFLLWRNNIVCSVRRQFIYTEDFPASYDALPDYDSMLFKPKYWTLWTATHWRAWLARQGAQA